MEPHYSGYNPDNGQLEGSELTSLLYLRKNWPWAGRHPTESFQLGLGGESTIRPLASTVSKSKSMSSSAERSLILSRASREPMQAVLPKARISPTSAQIIPFRRRCKRKNAPPPHPRYVRLPLGCGRAGSNFQGSGYKAGSRCTFAAGYATRAPVGITLPSMYISGPTFRRNAT